MFHAFFLAYYIGLTTIIIGLFVALALGYVFAKLLSKSAGPTFEEENKNLELELTKSRKNENIIKKQLQRIESEKAKLEEKLKASNEKIKAESANLQKVSSELNLKNEQTSKLGKDLSALNDKFNITQKRLTEIQTKFAGDKKEAKSWKKEIEEITNLHKQELHKSERLQRKIETLQSELEDFNDLKEEVNPIKRTLKGRDKEITRLKGDIEYWEKKHYDAHHQLASNKTELENLNAKIKHLVDSMNGQKIQNDNMLKMLADYKGNLITANEKYYKLAKQLEN